MILDMSKQVNELREFDFWELSNPYAAQAFAILLGDMAVLSDVLYIKYAVR